jgi:2-polyprenyl-6-methoxyphenol hydroxylase-like FAD-dependent oxidoreductase
LLSRIPTPDKLEALLEGFQALRSPRVARVASDAWANRKFFHVSDGNEQQLRDAKMQGDGPTHNNAEQGNNFIRKDKNTFIYNYDAEQEAERWLKEFQF